LSTLVAQRSERAAGDAIPWRMILVVTLMAGAFLLAPGDLRHKAHLILGGMCAQRPSHSFLFSGQPLPVDARMTGIYFGTASSLVWFILAHRARISGRFSRTSWTLMGLGIVLMAVDGLNSLTADLALPAPYVTTNLLRVTTGLLAGVAIGALLSHLVTISLTHRPRGGWAAAPAQALLAPLVLGAAVCLLAMSGLPTLAVPLTMLIMAAAITTLWAMTSVVLALALRRAWGFASSRQGDVTLALALIAACVVLVALAGWRVWLEQIIGPKMLS
jgi:uncharacterized membrane protein